MRVVHDCGSEANYIIRNWGQFRRRTVDPAVDLDLHPGTLAKGWHVQIRTVVNGADGTGYLNSISCIIGNNHKYIGALPPSAIPLRSQQRFTRALGVLSMPNQQI